MSEMSEKNSTAKLKFKNSKEVEIRVGKWKQILPSRKPKCDEKSVEKMFVDIDVDLKFISEMFFKFLNN